MAFFFCMRWSKTERSGVAGGQDDRKSKADHSAVGGQRKRQCRKPPTLCAGGLCGAGGVHHCRSPEKPCEGTAPRWCRWTSTCRTATEETCCWSLEMCRCWCSPGKRARRPEPSITARRGSCPSPPAGRAAAACGGAGGAGRGFKGHAPPANLSVTTARRHAKIHKGYTPCIAYFIGNTNNPNSPMVKRPGGNVPRTATR